MKHTRHRRSSSTSSKEIEKRTDFYLPPIPDPSADTSNVTSEGLNSEDRVMLVDIICTHL